LADTKFILGGPAEESRGATDSLLVPLPNQNPGSVPADYVTGLQPLKCIGFQSCTAEIHPVISSLVLTVTEDGEKQDVPYQRYSGPRLSMTAYQQLLFNDYSGQSNVIRICRILPCSEITVG